MCSDFLRCSRKCGKTLQLLEIPRFQFDFHHDYTADWFNFRFNFHRGTPPVRLRQGPGAGSPAPPPTGASRTEGMRELSGWWSCCRTRDLSGTFFRKMHFRKMHFSKILQIFGGLVLGCIKTKFCKKICVRQHFSSSTRFASFCTAAISKFSQKIGLKKQQFSWNFSKKLQMSQNLQNFVKFQKFQLDNLVDFEKCCKTHIYLQKSVPIQPKTSNILPKFCQKFATTRRLPRSPRPRPWRSCPLSRRTAGGGRSPPGARRLG